MTLLEQFDEFLSGGLGPKNEDIRRAIAIAQAVEERRRTAEGTRDMMPPLPPPTCDTHVFKKLWNESAVLAYGLAVAEACAQIVDDHRGPIEIYNKRYPAFLECAAAIREMASAAKP